MPDPVTAAYGSWRSPITSDLIVADSVSLSDVLLDGDDVYWVEGRPREGGAASWSAARRTAKRPTSTPRPSTPGPASTSTAAAP